MAQGDIRPDEPIRTGNDVAQRAKACNKINIPYFKIIIFNI
jgi:hypothetical protein